MKKITNLLIVFIFSILSIFYTNKSIDILKANDPIMQEIKKTKEKYYIDPINAIIEDDKMISGTYGKEIDYLASYNKMKRYGTYNEALTVLKETKPKISVEDNYDKYLIKGNTNKRNISLVFKLTEQKDITNLISLLEEKNVQVTFFIDGTLLENNINEIKKLSNHEIEILSYNNKIDNVLLKTSISYLETITNRKPKFCYTENNNDKLLDICKSNKLHTIKPTLILNNNIYEEIKKHVEKNIVITLNDYQINDLSYSIDYLKSKGYNIVTISDLFNEN